MTESLPPCPITGRPAAEKLEDISPKLLSDLWRWGARVEPTPLRRDGPRLGLYRSDCGLIFFHPAIAGDGAFYAGLYRRFKAHAALGARIGDRADLAAAAGLVRPGDRVLDVGCGEGAFARLVPQADYTGLEPHTDPLDGPGPRILAETVEAHAAGHAGTYDLVCAFQVLEHAADPRGMAAAMADCLKPGGLLVLAMPIQPSALTAIPNNLVNLPPHHLTWWSEAACVALAAELGLEAVRIGPVPASRLHAALHWAVRICPVAPPGRHVQRGVAKMILIFLSFQLARVVGAVLGLPKGAGPIDVVLVAQKPVAR